MLTWERSGTDAVCSAALAELAGAMEAELAGPPRDRELNGDPAVTRARFGAVGRGYLRFAREEPGLFRTAFSVRQPALTRLRRARGVAEVFGGFQLLGSALDGLMEVGVLPPESRPGAEFLAWSAVHGLRMLLIDGPCADSIRLLGMTLGGA